MDADEALQALRLRNRYVRELPSGLWAKVALPRARDALIAGQIPMPVLRQMAKMADAGEEDMDISPESLEHIARYQAVLVQRALKALGSTQAEVEGAPDLDYGPEVVAELAQEDFDQIFAWADRNEPIDPKASEPQTSPDSPPAPLADPSLNSVPSGDSIPAR